MGRGRADRAKTHEVCTKPPNVWIHGWRDGSMGRVLGRTGARHGADEGHNLQARWRAEETSLYLEEQGFKEQVLT